MTSLRFLQELNKLISMKIFCSYKVACSDQTNTGIKIRSNIKSDIVSLKTLCKMQDVLLVLNIMEITTIRSICIDST